jgi:hypothetical protein
VAAIFDVFHAVDSKPFGPRNLAVLTREQWSSMRLRTIDACELIDTTWAVDEIIDAVTNRREGSQPSGREGRILVWRKQLRVCYRPLQSSEAKAIAMLRNGLEFASLCDALAEEFGGRDAPKEILKMLRGWLADALLAEE